MRSFVKIFTKLHLFGRQHSFYTFVLVFSDMAMLSLAAFLALKVRFWPIDLIDGQNGLVHPQLLSLMLYSIICIAVFQNQNLYKPQVFIYLASHQVYILKSLIWCTFGLIFLSFAVKLPQYLIDSRLTIFYFFLFSVLIVSFYRLFIFRNLYLWLASNKIMQRRVIIVGAGPSGRQVAAGIMLGKPNDRDLIGFVDDGYDDRQRIFNGVNNLGPLKRLQEFVKVHDIDEIIVAISSVSHKRLLEIIQICQITGVNVKIYSELFNILNEKVPLEQVNDVHLVAVSRFSQSLLYRILKRVLDIAGSIILLILAIPFILLIMIAIKLESRGPAIYEQIRIGKNGKPFTFFKFRSMRVNNDDKDHRSFITHFIKGEPVESSQKQRKVYKMVEDPRVTRVGKLIRVTSLDELPQIINVIKGDMSLVGPRPCMPYEWEEYKEWHKQRLSVAPGCTGLWQVSGRSTVGFDDMVVLDLYYIKNMSLWFDLQLILKTLPVMLSARGGH